MSATIRKFILPWDQWSKRWVDPALTPWCAPYLVADCGTDGYFIGPFMSERGEVRPDLVRYADFSAAAHDYHLTTTDFMPASVWARGLSPLGDIGTRLEEHLRGATRLMSAKPPKRVEYLGAASLMLKLAMDAWRTYHAAISPSPDGSLAATPPYEGSRVLPRTTQGLSEAATARLKVRDRAVSLAATSRIAKMVAPTGAGGPHRIHPSIAASKRADPGEES